MTITHIRNGFLTGEQCRQLLDVYGPIGHTRQITDQQIEHALKTGTPLGMPREISDKEIRETVPNYLRKLTDEWPKRKK